MTPTSVKLGERKKKLEAIAKKKGVTLHALIVALIDNYLKKSK